MKDFLDRLTLVHGRLSDLRAVWFPFFFLKPKSKIERITSVRRFFMTVCFSWYGACFWPVKQLLFSQPVDQREWIIFSLKTFAFFAIWFRLVTTPLWNRRVRMIEEGVIVVDEAS